MAYHDDGDGGAFRRDVKGFEGKAWDETRREGWIREFEEEISLAVQEEGPGGSVGEAEGEFDALTVAGFCVSFSPWPSFAHRGSGQWLISSALVKQWNTEKRGLLWLRGKCRSR